MYKVKRVIILILGICLFTIIPSMQSFAASSASVKVSSTTGNVGSTVTVKCSATTSGTSIGGADVTLVYDSAALSVVSCSSGANGSAGGVYFSQNASGSGQNTLSFTVSFKILKEGKSSITVSNADVFDWDTASLLTTNKSSGSVTGKKVSTDSGSETKSNENSNIDNTEEKDEADENDNEEEKKDSNTKLKSIQISPGTLEPAFHENTTTYKVNVAEDIKEVKITALPQNDKAQVEISGNKDLKFGVNEVNIKVTAEDGSNTAYQIIIECGEPDIIEIQGMKCTFNEEISDEEIPAGFSRTKITYNGHEYEALENEWKTLKLVSLKNDTEKMLYIYDEEMQEFYDFILIYLSEGKYIIPLPLSKISGFESDEFMTLTLQEKKFYAWKINDEYCTLPVITSEGKNLIYQYDTVDATWQRYLEMTENEDTTEINPLFEKYPYLEKYAVYIIIGLSALCVLLIITIILLIIIKNAKSKKRRYHQRKRKVRKKMEMQKKKLAKQQKE